MVANEQIKQIASRIIYMRETLELSQQDVAEKNRYAAGGIHCL